MLGLLQTLLVCFDEKSGKVTHGMYKLWPVLVLSLFAPVFCDANLWSNGVGQLHKRCTGLVVFIG